MERLDRLSEYFNEKERKRLSSSVKDSFSGLPVMSKDEIKLSCLENNGYESPELNDKLYLHFRGFKKIENLEPYTGCKAIWLDSNGFEKIEGLDTMQGLRCLYISKNLISKIEGLESLQLLHTIDLSYNRLSMLTNLSCCPQLNTINLSRNALTTADSIVHLQECKALTTIDLTNNFLEADPKFIEVFAGIPSMTTLSVNGNDVTKVSHFRKLMIANITRMGYLDRPVEEVEKIGAIAFLEGGADAELAARNAYRDSLREKKSKEMADFKIWQAEQRKQRAADLAAGRAKILELTPEEMEERQRGAKAAADAERKLLEVGIDKVAARYWKLEGNGSSKQEDCLDILEAATAQTIAEHERNESVNNESECAIDILSKARIEIIESDDEDASPCNNSQQNAIFPPAPPTEEELLAQAELAKREAEERAIAEKQAEIARIEAEKAAVAAREAAAKLAEEQKREKAEERERQQRVADSMRIYKEQLAAEKRKAEAKEKKQQHSSHSSNHNNNDKSIEDHVHLSEIEREWASTGSTTFPTWESAAAALCTDNRASDVFYWTEAMDMKLAQEVRKCVFEFDAVAKRLQAACLDGEFGLDRYATVVDPSQFTSEACRLRWAQLHAEQWCQAGPDSGQNEASFKVYVSPEVLQAKEQPSFEALARMSASHSSAYFKPPTVFPTVRDNNNDDDDDDDEIFEAEPVHHQMATTIEEEFEELD